MKKILTLLLFIPLVFACSDDEYIDNNENNTDGVLPSTVTVDVFGDGTSLYTTTYNYDGNKIISKFVVGVTGTYEQIYTYNENKISLIHIYDNGELRDHYFQINYNSQGMISEVISIFDDLELTLLAATITYNSNESLTVDSYGSTGIIASSRNYNIDNNGNEIYWVEPSSNPGHHCDEIQNIEYDNYNNPFKNITGISNLGILHTFIGYNIRTNFEGFFGIYGLNNNPTKLHYYTEECDDAAYEFSSEYTFSYDYNDAGYPISLITSYNNFFDIVTIEYTE